MNIILFTEGRENMQGKNEMFRILSKKIDQISINMEKFKLVDYMELLEHPRKMLYANFISGLARGFGMAIGFTILGAFAVYLLQIVVRWKLPVIGDFISEIVRIVQDKVVK